MAATVHTLDFTDPPPAGRRECEKRQVRISGSLAFVPLTRGLEAVIDAQDAIIAGSHKWHAAKRGATYYAARSVAKNGGKRAIIYLHREILGDAADGFYVDHIDGNGLNNVRANLRAATHKQNCRNARVKKSNTSGFRGVYYSKRDRNWVAQITVDRKTTNLGRFATAQDASRAYAIASAAHHKEFGVGQNRSACDLCGEDAVELRLMDGDGWTADTFTCRECFGTHDGPDFTDLDLIQEAIRHV